MKIVYIRPVREENEGPNYAEIKDKVLKHFYNNKRLYVAAYMLAINAIAPTHVFAEGGINGGISLIKLMQQGSFWVGLGVSIWGVVEAQLDYPGWKGRVMKGVLGYIAILLLPLVFIELRDNLQVDVWQQLEGGGN